jgi:2-keto-4-pentenoate hydratase/2-oxohepta-3-ene-1,7-dioic acid hydratase in catechol pathway
MRIAKVYWKSAALGVQSAPMRYCTFQHGHQTYAGLVRGTIVYDLASAFFKSFKRPFKFRDLLAFLEADGPERLKEVDLAALARDREVCMPLREVRLRAPLLRPPKIVCVGLNYRAHAAEQNLEPPKAPMLFAKAPNIVIGPDDEIRIPYGISEQIDYECELAVVVGKGGSRIAKGDAAKHVLGYTILNDVTARDVQRGDKQWFRGKSMDTFAPLGPVVVTPDELDASKAPVKLKVNGQVRQDSNTSDLIFDVPFLVEYLSASFPLEAGDVISTGTPGGVGVFMTPPRWLRKGDRVEASIEGIGTLCNTVV